MKLTQVGTRLRFFRKWFSRRADREDDGELDVAAVVQQDLQSHGSVDVWLHTDPADLPLERRTEGARELAMAAEDRMRQRDFRTAHGLFQRALSLVEDGEGNAGLSESPWLKDFVQAQRLASSRVADLIADASREIDDREALRWWRESATALGQLTGVDSSHREEVDFLYQKVLGEAATANYRIGIAANQQNDNCAAAEAWDQASKLAGHLIKRYPAQPSWVNELHAITLRSGASTYHHIAKSVRDLDVEQAVRNWTRAAKLFGQLLEQYPAQPDWVVSVYANVLRNAGAACHAVARTKRDVDLMEAARLWERGATMLRKLMNSELEQPAWVPKVFENILRNGATAFLDAAQVGKQDNRASNASTPPSSIQARAAGDDGEVCKRRGVRLYAELVRRFPKQPDWVRSRFSEAEILAVGKTVVDQQTSLH